MFVVKLFNFHLCDQSFNSQIIKDDLFEFRLLLFIYKYEIEFFEIEKAMQMMMYVLASFPSTC